MIFVTGGAAQGKRRYVRETWKIPETETADAEDQDIREALMQELCSGKIREDACVAAVEDACVYKNTGIAAGAHANAGARQGVRCVTHYQALIRQILAQGADPEEYTAQLIDAYPDLIIVMEEIGCGIVPLDKEERIWREACGRCGCLIASRADRVIRLVCGIPMVIRDACEADRSAGSEEMAEDDIDGNAF